MSRTQENSKGKRRLKTDFTTNLEIIDKSEYTFQTPIMGTSMSFSTISLKLSRIQGLLDYFRGIVRTYLTLLLLSIVTVIL